ncbi:hypothetical protein MHYP_G00111120 [Metynnis hypsauchen]
MEEQQNAPTLKVALQRARQTIEVQKKEIERLKEKIVFLDEDRNYLRETLRDGFVFVESQSVKHDRLQHGRETVFPAFLSLGVSLSLLHQRVTLQGYLSQMNRCQWQGLQHI